MDHNPHPYQYDNKIFSTISIHDLPDNEYSKQTNNNSCDCVSNRSEKSIPSLYIDEAEEKDNTYVISNDAKTKGKLMSTTNYNNQRKVSWIKRSWSKFNELIPSYLVIYPLISFMIWSMLWIICGDLALPGPNGSVFAVLILEILAIVFGKISQQLEYPPLLGMIGAGLLFRNCPYLSELAEPLDTKITNPLRAMSVVVLLIRGGLAVNPTIIRKYKWIIPQMSVGTCIIEALAGTTAVYFITDFPLQWAAAIGCIFSGMSSAAVTPYLLKLEKRGLGKEHNVIAVAKQGTGLDAILAISMTEFAFGFIFAYGDLVQGFRKGVCEVLLGISFAIIWGTLAGIFLNKSHGHSLRTFVVFTGGSMSLLGLTKLGWPRGGPIGCFFGAVIAGCMWRNKGFDGNNNDNVNAQCTDLWFFFQPLLFGIVGSRVDLSTVNWNLISLGILCLVISTIVRACSAFSLQCFAKDFTIKEKLFMVVSWLPKGTVQAALGPVALETVLQTNQGPEMETLAYNVQCIVVTTIVLASTFGATMILLLGPRLLRK